MGLGNGSAGASFGGGVRRGSDTRLGGGRAKGLWKAVCYGADGAIKWVEEWENIVVNAGLDHLLDVTLSGATQITTWYIGLVDGGSAPSYAAADTMASHAGWTENTGYSDATRLAWTDGGVSSQSVDNSGSVASFSINASGTIAGAFLTSDNTKSGTTGTLYAEGSFASNKTVSNGDTLEVTATFTMADDAS